MRPILAVGIKMRGVGEVALGERGVCKYERKRMFVFGCMCGGWKSGGTPGFMCLWQEKKRMVASDRSVHEFACVRQNGRQQWGNVSMSKCQYEMADSTGQGCMCDRWSGGQQSKNVCMHECG